MKSIKILLLFFFLFSYTFSCTYVQKIKDGKTAFGQKQYAVAIDFLVRDYTKAQTMMDRGNIAFMIGESYRLNGQNANAINWYQKAYENDYGADALSKYADALKMDEQYALARDNYKEAGIQIGSPFEFRKKITACNIAEGWMKEKDNSGYHIENVSWNTSNSEFAPSFYQNKLVVTTDYDATGVGHYKWTGKEFMDLKIIDPKTGDIESFGKPINSVFNDGTATFNADFSTIIFTRCSGDEHADQFCALYSSVRSADDVWSTPIILDFIEPSINYINPSLNENGDILYFASNNPDGWGGYDLYVSFWDGEEWTSPKILSRAINTIGNERFPFVVKDTLFFSSDYHTGMGGLDIFKSYKIDGKNWSSVKNLMAPINSGGDDFGFIVKYKSDGLGKGYFSSNRKGGQGNDDIYAFNQYIPEIKVEEIPKDTLAHKIVYKLILDGFVLEKIFKNNNPNGKLMGRKPLAGASLQIDVLGKSKRIQIGEDGTFSLNLKEDTDYLFTASKQGYLSNTVRFSTKGIGKDKLNPEQHFEIELVLDKIFVDKEIVLNNIYYDFNKWDIRSDAKPTLNELANILMQNPTINIQLSSHTDCRGKNSSNLVLSQKRAQSAVDYIISLGIESSRLTAKGYGEDFPAIPCKCQSCTEDEHQANRRSTFKIVKLN